MKVFNFIPELSVKITTAQLGSIVNFQGGLRENSDDKQKNKTSALILKLRSEGINIEKICNDMKDLQRMREEMRIKCGNVKCKRDYLFDKYNCKFFRNRDNNLNDLAMAEYNKNLHLWKNKKCIETNAWKICKGCRATYFCSRRYQKIAWKYGNAEPCKELQIFGSKLSNQ